MSEDRLCVICAAPQAIVEQCLGCITSGTDALYFVPRGMTLSVMPPQEDCVGFDTRIRPGDDVLSEAFIDFEPTAVVLVCELFEHDEAVAAIMAWSRQAGIAPQIFVYQNHILHEGYLEVIRKYPGLTRPGAGR